MSDLSHKGTPTSDGASAASGASTAKQTTRKYRCCRETPHNAGARTVRRAALCRFHGLVMLLDILASWRQSIKERASKDSSYV